MNKVHVLAAALMLASHVTFAEVAIIAHPSNDNVMDATAISHIFLGKIKNFPNGSQAVPIGMVENSITEEFNNKVLSRTANQLKAYWSKLVFTGKGTPPKELDSNTDVLQLVASNPNLIGYISADAVDGSVKVVATF
jgi:ABC-type phosphate transport system substrate-binding protein